MSVTYLRLSRINGKEFVDYTGPRTDARRQGSDGTILLFKITFLGQAEQRTSIGINT